MPDGNTQSVIGTGPTVPMGGYHAPILGGIGKLAEALAAAQGEIKGAIKGKQNPHFRSSYADLAAVWDACRAALAKHKLAVMQTTHSTGNGWILRTTLAHSSGETMVGEFPLNPIKPDMQGLMAATTYARRAGLAAMVGVCGEDEDDDGNTAAGHTNGATKDTSPPPQVKKSALPPEPSDAVKKSVNRWIEAQIEAVTDAASMDTLLAWENETDKDGETNLHKMNRIVAEVWPLAGNRLKGAYLTRQAELNPANGD